MHLNRTHFSVTISGKVKSHDIAINLLINSEMGIPKILHPSRLRKKIKTTDELQGMVHNNCHTSNLIISSMTAI